PTGRDVIDRFITEAPQYLRPYGRVLLVQSSLSNVEATLNRFHKKGLEARILAEQKAMFETITIVEAQRRN
ncbi:protoporphyrinogen oxidase, partial [Candidatus Bathyarchaeota archaeon]|nr:protoporphyrinogen oxidase [Candidatus Bathyarchaeota archaeon]NIV45088.1 protoporphyrinogen oxidase [Candidatus Bathyarchaeota archaeon]